MGTTPVRRIWLGCALLATCAGLLAVPAVAKNQQTARAEEVRSRCVRELASKSSWHAQIVETERGSDGKRAVLRQDVLVRRPGEYRLTVREIDEKGKPVVSTTIRANQTFYTHRTNADGSTELHIVRGARPSLGVELDNLLGQTVQAVKEAQPLKVVGTENRAGRAVDKLSLGGERYAWVDRDTGIPVGEQTVSGEGVSHDVTIEQFQADASAPDERFDPSSLGSADSTVTEDLGFRPAARELAERVLGFALCDVPDPAGYALEAQGYVDPRVNAGDGPAEAAYVSAFSSGSDALLVTQVHRPGAGEFLSGASQPDGAERVDLDGAPGLFYPDAIHPQLVFVRRDVLVTLEGNLPVSAMTEFARRIR